jgi:3-hydroxymyristoyl/3-hydroxydecanoyl-(acyl carrier protein) dehydratase
VAAVGPFKFPAAAGAGATLDARARVAGRMGGLIKIEGTVTADGVLVATGSLTLAHV